MQDETGAARRPLSVFDRFVVVLNAIGSLFVLLLVLAIDVDAFGRTFFNRPIAGIVEMVAVSLAVIVFCQLADTVRLGKLTRSDSFLVVLARGRFFGRAVAAGFELLGALVMGLIVVGTVPLLIQSYQRGYFTGIRGVFTFPDWPLKALIVLGAIAAFLCFLRRAWRLWRGEGRATEDASTRAEG